ncbi:hypothetical protein E2562_012040 [Oryza meyeriana var. granulata]|uniref:Uncharacterized protein n=1 Tax=Oryza meyeriana var. granulata TaxID=110450 RepID=A0A6G1D2L5_9ORYZ|nr:hypothetical protein E2562_012040 [Oryza meyeriana var. granulata]
MKKISRELSNYIMYLVFKCGVMLTVNSHLIHDQALREIGEIIYYQRNQQVNLSEKEAVMMIYYQQKEEQGPLTANEKLKQQELDGKDNDTGSRVQELWQSTMEALNCPVLPRACQVASELMNISDEADRWKLISDIWLEMLYYTAPRCGGAFHYEHLSTGGEFITHVLLLIRFLGPFLPIPPAATA